MSAVHALPSLREDLLLSPGPLQEDGSPTWTLHDPVRNRYFRLGWLQFEMLRRWSLGDGERLLHALHRETTLRPEAADVERLTRFLLNNALLSPAWETAREALARRGAQAPPPLWRTLLHHYLFFRLPLVAPDRFLEALLPWVGFLFSPWFRRLVLVLGGLGIFLVSRQWDAFWGTLLRFLSWDGAVWYGVALFLVKALHELGHALTAKRHGLCVPTMGVAFLVLWPVLYSDLSDAWRLAGRRERMAVAWAGVATEIGVALLATLAWSFVSDGALRHVLFFLATTSWLSSLAINLNPLLRFDGYFLLADAWETPNLQERAFALARWHLRQSLAGIRHPAPEIFSPRQQRRLLVFAYACWIYRLVLFTGIALFVYHLFFKLLGLFLFVVEMGWFIIAPVGRELAYWWQRRTEMGWNRTNLVASAVLLSLGTALILPWSSRVVAPALLKADQEGRVHAPVAARLEAIHVRKGDAVRRGDRLFDLQAPALLLREQEARLRGLTLEADLARQESHTELVGRSSVTRQELAQARTTLEGLRREIQRLQVVSPQNGVVVELVEGARPGLWVENGLLLARVVDPSQAVVTGYLAEGDLARVAPGAACLFEADERGQRSLPCTVATISPFASSVLEEPELGAPHGGGIDVELAADGRLLPRQAIYGLTVALSDKEPAPMRVVRGVVLIQGAEEAPLARWGRLAHALLVREGFF